MSNQVTVADLDDLMKSIAEQEETIEAHKEVSTRMNKELAQLENRAVQYLKDLGREEYVSPYGKGAIEQKWRVNLPEDDIKKREFFDYLRALEIFDKYATVNSNSLNSLYRAEWEAAKQDGRGMEFTMPGIGAPKVYEQFKFKPAKS